MLLDRNSKHFEFYWRWNCNMLQVPHEVAGIVLIIAGLGGVGKSQIKNAIARVIGAKKFLSTKDPEINVWGRFTVDLLGKIGLELNEVGAGSIKPFMNKIKALVDMWP